MAGLAISRRGGQVLAVKPIFLDESELFLGETIGQETDRWEAIIAKRGYAVSAVQISESDSARDVKLEFIEDRQ